ncbi:MAG: nucleotide exchange factor GrpE [Bacteroidota bacterium]
MENTIKTESELEKHDDSVTETPTGQSSEVGEPENKENQPDGTLDPLKKLQDELAEAKDKFVRLYAEFENHRRRTAKEKLEMILSANEQLIKTLLPIADDFERAEKSFTDKSNKELEGLFLIQGKFKKILDQNGVKAMEFTNQSDFNPDLHEAITQLPAPDEKMKGKVMDVVEKGYLLNDKVIRFAKVVIGN